MSHLRISELKIFHIKKTNCPICIDTEGAQIRSKFIGRKFLKSQLSTLKNTMKT